MLLNVKTHLEEKSTKIADDPCYVTHACHYHY